MAGLWDSIKDQTAPARDIANGGSEVVEDPVRGAPIRVVRTEGLKFKPVNPDYRNVVVAVEDEDSEAIKGTFTEEHIRAAVDQFEANDGAEPRVIVTVEKQSELLPVDDFSDLVGDLSAIDEKRVETRGRPRKYPSNAQRQLAYRLSKKAKTKSRKK